MTADLSLLLQGIPALSSLPAASLKELAGALVRRSAARGEYLFRQGEGPPPNVFFLLTAAAEILVGPPDDERAVSLSRPGQLVGWLTLFSTEPFPASARVVEPGEVLQIRAEVIQEGLERHPAVGRVLAATMAQRIAELFGQIRAQAIQGPLARAETFPFRRRVTEVMATPVLTVAPDASCRSAARQMEAAKASSLVVVGEAGHPTGLVTEKDLVQRVMAAGRDPDATTVATVMTAPVATLDADAYVYKALGIMRRLKVRHLPVVDGERLVGMLSMRALMTLGRADTLELAEQIEGANSIDGLATAHGRSLTVCTHLLEEGTPAEDVSRLLSRINRDLHRRVLQLVLEELESAGWGKPPARFCFILMGSHGRGENHFHTDQDHGMILEDYPPEAWGQVEPYFMELSRRVSEALATVGFPSCRGYVMSSNPVWRKPMREWKDQVLGWFGDPGSRAVRYTTLFYDFLPIWGDAGLARDLRGFITEGIQHHFQLLRSLFDEAAHHKVPLTLFKNFVTKRRGPHKGHMDLKRSGLLFVVECARILALRNGVTDTSTLGRLTELAARGAIPAEEGEFVATAYKTLFHFLLRAQAAKLRAGEPVDNYVDPAALTIQERYLLRHALEATGRLQAMVHSSFGEIFF